MREELDHSSPRLFSQSIPNRSQSLFGAEAMAKGSFCRAPRRLADRGGGALNEMVSEMRFRLRKDQFQPFVRIVPARSHPTSAYLSAGARLVLPRLAFHRVGKVSGRSREAARGGPRRSIRACRPSVWLPMLMATELACAGYRRDEKGLERGVVLTSRRDRDDLLYKARAYWDSGCLALDIMFPERRFG
jgi:hypothetical protein